MNKKIEIMDKLRDAAAYAKQAADELEANDETNSRDSFANAISSLLYVQAIFKAGPIPTAQQPIKQE
jgi:hypothetical protein